MSGPTGSPGRWIGCGRPVCGSATSWCTAELSAPDGQREQRRRGAGSGDVGRQDPHRAAGRPEADAAAVILRLSDGEGEALAVRGPGQLGDLLDPGGDTRDPGDRAGG